jgi:hypothetical protein
MVVTLHTYMDAPDLAILGGVASHDLKSKPLTVGLRGPIRFVEDGRLSIVLANAEEVVVTVGVDVLGIGVSSMDLAIAPGGMTVDLRSAAPRGGER